MKRLFLLWALLLAGSALLLASCSRPARAQVNVPSVFFEKHQASINNVTTGLEVKNSVITLVGANGEPQMVNLASFRYGQVGAAAAKKPAARPRNLDGDRVPFLLGTAEAKARGEKAAKAAAEKAKAAAAAAKAGGSLRAGVTSKAFVPMDTGPQVTLPVVTTTIDIESLDVVNGDMNYVNDDGTWNKCPYAVNATAAGPVPDVNPPAGFVAGVRGGAPSGYKYYYDAATTHVFGTWNAGIFGNGVLGTGGLLNGAICYLSGTTSASAAGSIVNKCICTCTTIVWCTVEGRRQRIGGTNPRTSRHIVNTKRLNVTVMKWSTNIIAWPSHLELTQICVENPNNTMKP